MTNKETRDTQSKTKPTTWHPLTTMIYLKKKKLWT